MQRGKYPIVGIVNFPSPDLNKRMVYLPLEVAQYFFGAENLVTTVALNLENKDAVPPAVKALRKALPSGEYEVMDWKQLMPDLMKAREADAAGAYLMLFVLYVIIAFGIYGTILMMTKEREYEFGVLISIGMKRLKLGATIWIEIILLGILGSIAGILGAIPLVYYFNTHPLDLSQMSEEATGIYEKWGFDPIFPTAFEPGVFWVQALVVFLITAVLAFYPLLKIIRLKPVEAMRA
ncbi:MAG: ABC transporter permease [Saprospirales bacterium]|nr:ABC transporter permease [Saprospirales bacterium]